MKKMLILLAVLLAGCASMPSEQAKKVQVVRKGQVQNCQFLSYVFGNSELTNLASDIGIANAKYEAQEHAAQIGATHIVWANVQAHWDVTTSVTGSAYLCG